MNEELKDSDSFSRFAQETNQGNSNLNFPIFKTADSSPNC
jgi:hypothetical protein